MNLQIVKNAAVQTLADTVQLKTPRPLRVLVFDEDQSTAVLLVSLLRMGGHEVEGIDDGRYALDAARRFRPDVIILDIGLPEMGGYVVARAFLDDSCVDRVTIIAVSGYAEEVVTNRPRESGFDLRLMKSVDVSLLLASMDNMTEDGLDSEPFSVGRRRRRRCP